ncbi:MAG: tetratricopeptide repeat protein, partial [Planctomycetaceae bacterium]
DFTLTYLDKKPPTQRMYELITRTKDRRVLPFLIRHFDEVPDQRSQLIGMIAILGDNEAVDFLVKRYDQLQPHDQSAVLNALRQLQSPQFLPLAGKALNSQDMSLVSTACQGLQLDASPEAVKMLVEAFDKSENNNTWQYISNSLANLANPDANEVLLKAQRSKNKAKSAVARNALMQIRQRSPGYQYVYQARQAIQEKRLDDAITHYNLSLKLDPNLPDAYAGRGNVYLQQSKLTEALADFRKAVELDEFNSQAITGLCVILVQEGKIDEGIKTIETEREKFEGDSLFAYNSACVYGRAVEYLQKQDATPERDKAIGEYQQIAVEQLKKSIELGFGDLEWMKKDPDLNSLHELPGFKEIAAGMPAAG